jgi:hypothetical protein
MALMTGLELIAAASLSAGLAGLTGWPLRRLARTRLDAVKPPPDPDLAPFTGIYPQRFQSPHDQGAFGEALTFALMAAHGWRPVNGKPGTGPQGIDGVFWKRDASGWRARLIETKTNTSGYRAISMSDAKLIADLDTLYLTAGEPALRGVYSAISKGLQTGDPRVDKQLWRHQLEAGRTLIDALAPDGRMLAGRSFRPVQTQMEGMLMATAELDRAGAILNPGAR